MSGKIDLQKIDMFDKAVRAFRIVSATDEAAAPGVDLTVTRTEHATELGALLREQQQRARANRTR